MEVLGQNCGNNGVFMQILVFREFGWVWVLANSCGVLQMTVQFIGKGFGGLKWSEHKDHMLWIFACFWSKLGTSCSNMKYKACRVVEHFIHTSYDIYKLNVWRRNKLGAQDKLTLHKVCFTRMEWLLSSQNGKLLWIMVQSLG